MREYPFNRIPLEKGESLELARTNPALHRPFTLSVALSDRALYLHVWRFFRRARWFRFPYRGIDRVIVSPLASGRTGALLATAALLVFTSGIQLAQGATGAAALAVALVLLAGLESLKRLHGRSEMHVLASGSSFHFRTPLDGYAEEKQFDRQLLRDVADELRKRGISVEDRL